MNIEQLNLRDQKTNLFKCTISLPSARLACITHRQVPFQNLLDFVKQLNKSLSLHLLVLTYFLNYLNRAKGFSKTKSVLLNLLAKQSTTYFEIFSFNKGYVWKMMVKPMI